MEKKTVGESQVVMSELVLPTDTNSSGNLFGGKLMQWIDIAGALTASKHSRKKVVTIVVDSLDFKHPIRQGELVELNAKVTWVGRSSIEVKICVCAENLLTGHRILSNEAYIVYVALDENEKPVAVPELLLETEEEKAEYEKAIIRRAHRLEMKAL
jgi:acyl-CoA hydrolase